jgi:iron complex transport system substrate-binding protein
MIRKIIQFLSLLLVLDPMSFGEQQRILKDDLGFPFVVGSPPQKIISLAPNITEILFSLGLGEKVSGVTRYCDYPPQAKEKEKIGGIIDLSIERIKALNPDLVIGFRGNPLQSLDRLRKLGLSVFVLDIGEDIESVLLIIQKIGAITRSEKEAEALVQSLRKKYDETRSALENVEHEPKVFLSIHGPGFWTCGKESFLNDLVTKARGVNIAGNISRKWLLYSQEQLINENPEIIVILSRSQEEFIEAKKSLESKSYFKRIKAVSSGKIFFLDQNLATRPGPRLVDALAELGRLLHPESFKERR